MPISFIYDTEKIIWNIIHNKKKIANYRLKFLIFVKWYIGIIYNFVM